MLIQTYLVFSLIAQAAPAAPAAPEMNQTQGSAPIGGMVTEVDKPLEITGQTRNFSMNGMLQDESDSFKFFKEKDNFRQEIEASPF